MLEIGGDFDDDLFGESKQRIISISQEAYVVKTCESHWYDDPNVNITGDMHSVYKYRGDAAFYKGHYDEALKHYGQSLAHIYSGNIPMWKDVTEAKARCLMHAGHKEEAFKTATQLTSLANNYDQRTTVLYLMADIYHTFHLVLEELTTVQALLTLHVSNPDLWLRLAHIYHSLHDHQGQGQNAQGQSEGRPCESNNTLQPLDEVISEVKSMNIEKIPQQPQPVIIKHVKIQDDTTRIQYDTTRIQDDTTRVHDDTTRIQDDTTRMQDDTTRIQDDTTRMQDDTTRIQENDVEKTQDDLLPGYIAVCTCLLQARYLLKNVQHTIHSFSKERNIQQLVKIEKEFEVYKLSDDMQYSCGQFLYHCKEDEEIQSDTDKLEALQKLSRKSFETRWFSWYWQHTDRSR